MPFVATSGAEITHSTFKQFTRYFNSKTDIERINRNFQRTKKQSQISNFVFF